MKKSALPWRVRDALNRTESFWLYSVNRMRWSRAPSSASRPPRLTVDIEIPDYGFTGGAYAIGSLASLLTNDFDCSIVTSPTASLVSHLHRQVRFKSRQERAGRVLITESGMGLDRIARFRDDGGLVILSHHGWMAPPESGMDSRNYGYSNPLIQQAVELADASHFISAAQMASFRDCGIVAQRHCVIANGVARAGTRQPDAAPRTRAGIVGDTRLAIKNVRSAVTAADASSAAEIHVWGRHDQRYGSGRVHWHGFSKDRNAVYDSFDVLLSLSTSETQPLVVLEALSAGLPCVLSRLDCYREFEGLPGFWFVDPFDTEGARQAINEALDCTLDVRLGLQRLWQQRYSTEATRQAWTTFIRSVCPSNTG